METEKCLAVPNFKRIKKILDDITTEVSVERMRQAHASENFGWATKEQLLNSDVWPDGPGGELIRLIAPELVEQGRGAETNLVKSLRDPTGVGFKGRMPLRPPPGRFATEQEIKEIIAWLDAGMPDS